MLTKILSSIVLVSSFLFAAGSGEAFARQQGEVNLSDELWGKTLNTFVAEPVDSSGKAVESLNTLKSAIEDELGGRMNIRFVIMERQEGADLLVECDIRAFTWTDKAAPSNEGIISTVANILGSNNEGAMEAFFTVTDLQKKKVIWDGLVKATVSSSDVTSQQGIEMLNERLAEMFVKNCFAKKKLRAAFPTRKEDPVGSY